MDHSRFDWVPDFVRDIADDVLCDWRGCPPQSGSGSPGLDNHAIKLSI